MSKAKSVKHKSASKTIAAIPLRDVVIYPYMVIPLFVGRENSVASLEYVMEHDKQIFLIAQKKCFK